MILPIVMLNTVLNWKFIHRKLILYSMEEEQNKYFDEIIVNQLLYSLLFTPDHQDPVLFDSNNFISPLFLKHKYFYSLFCIN